MTGSTRRVSFKRVLAPSQTPWSTGTYSSIQEASQMVQVPSTQKITFFHLCSKWLGGMGRRLLHLSQLHVDQQVPAKRSFPCHRQPASAWNRGGFALLCRFTNQLLYSLPPWQGSSFVPVQQISGQKRGW